MSNVPIARGEFGLAAAARVPDHSRVRGLGRRQARRRWGPGLLAVVAAVGFAGAGAGEARAGAPPTAEADPEPVQYPTIPRESPLYGPPYRRGIVVEVAVGLALCQPALVYGGVCGGASPPAPGLALRLGAGWRFGPHWQLSGAWIRQTHRPGGAFTSASSDGGMVAFRGIVPLPPRGGLDSRLDLGFELGLGWSQRVLSRPAAPTRLYSSGAVIRPALIFDGWVLADLALGIEIAPQINLHWQHCVDEACEPTPGPWVGSELERRWVDGFTIAVRATGHIFFHMKGGN